MSVFSSRDSTVGSGGALGTGNAGAAVSLRHCTFGNNLARQHGGAIRCSSSLWGLIQSCVFYKNKAFSGGAIFFSSGTKNPLLVDNSTFHRNSAQDSGGAMLILSLNLKLSNSLMSHNTAEVGSAVYCSELFSSFSVTNCTFLDNGLRKMSTAVWIANSAFKIRTSSFQSNAGIGLSLRNASGEIRNSSFHNHVKWDIRAGTPLSPLLITDTIFIRNSSTGTALYLLNQRTLIQNCTFLAKSDADTLPIIEINGDKTMKLHFVGSLFIFPNSPNDSKILMSLNSKLVPTTVYFWNTKIQHASNETLFLDRNTSSNASIMNSLAGKGVNLTGKISQFASGMLFSFPS